MKMCIRCKNEKPLNEFAKLKKTGMPRKTCQSCCKNKRATDMTAFVSQSERLKAAEALRESKNKIISADLYGFISRIRKVKHAST